MRSGLSVNSGHKEAVGFDRDRKHLIEANDGRTRSMSDLEVRIDGDLSIMIDAQSLGWHPGGGLNPYAHMGHIRRFMAYLSDGVWVIVGSERSH